MLLCFPSSSSSSSSSPLECFSAVSESKHCKRPRETVYKTERVSIEKVKHNKYYEFRMAVERKEDSGNGEVKSGRCMCMHMRIRMTHTHHPYNIWVSCCFCAFSGSFHFFVFVFSRVLRLILFIHNSKSSLDATRLLFHWHSQRIPTFLHQRVLYFYSSFNLPQHNSEAYKSEPSLEKTKSLIDLFSWYDTS